MKNLSIFFNVKGWICLCQWRLLQCRDLYWQ